MIPSKPPFPRWTQVAAWILVAKVAYLGLVLLGLRLWNHPEELPLFETRQLLCAAGVRLDLAG